MNNGTASSFQDNSSHGEDCLTIRELGSTASLDAVLDGVTHCEGGYASGFTAQLLQEAPIEDLTDLMAVLEQANSTLFQSGRGRRLLSTVTVALKLGDELHVISAGDSPAYLLRGGEVHELTPIAKAGTLPGLAGGAVGFHEKFTYEYKVLTLQPYDRLILVTDGLSSNVFPEQLAAIIRTAPSPQEAVFALQELANEKRRLHVGRADSYGTFKEDDRTAIFRYFD